MGGDKFTELGWWEFEGKGWILLHETLFRGHGVIE